MSNTTKETITVEQLGEWGVRVGKTWYNVGKFLKPSDFIPGNSYDIEVWTNEKGKKYINTMKKSGSVSKAQVQMRASATVAEAPEREKSTKEVSTVSYDDQKNKRILLQGILQASINAPGLFQFSANYEEWWGLVVQTFERGTKLIEERLK